MPTANERKALWFLALVALSGGGVRLWRANAMPTVRGDTAAIARQVERTDSARSRPRSRSGRQQGKVPEPAVATPQIIDLDLADASAIEALPGIGPALAKRIVHHRDSAGFFGGIRAFCDVRGIGPGLAERLRPLVTFNGARSPLSDECSDASSHARKAPSARSRKPR
jgi:DNA uptake protein ComE-like DNA-binding protein